MSLLSAGGPCGFGAPIDLGPVIDPESARFGYGARGGLGVWLEQPRVLRLRPLARDGTPTGSGHALQLDEGEEPAGILPLGEHFVLRLERKDLRDGGTRKWTYRGLVVLADGSPSSDPRPIDLPGYWISGQQTESRGGRIAMAGAETTRSPVLWIDVTRDRSGTLAVTKRPVEPALIWDINEHVAPVRGEGPLAFTMRRHAAVVIEGRVLALRGDPSLDRLRESYWGGLSGRWVMGEEPGLAGAPGRHLRVAWFADDRLRVARVRSGGEVVQVQEVPAGAPVPAPFEAELQTGTSSAGNGVLMWAHTNRLHTLFPAYHEAYKVAKLTLERERIEPGQSVWSGTHLILAFGEGSTLRVVSAICGPSI